MTGSGWALSDDIGVAMSIALGVLGAVAIVLLITELRFRERGGFLVLLSGVVSVVLFSLAVLRPVRIATKSARVGPRVVVLVDQSRRLLIPAGDTTRRKRALAAVKELEKHFHDARLSVMGFGQGAAKTLSSNASSTAELTVDSDLRAAAAAATDGESERPRAIVVVSDGRLSTPPPGELDAAAVGAVGVPVHTVAVERRVPADASIRSVKAAGAAVAHQSLALTVEVGCAGGLSCNSVPVTVTELRSGVEPALLASGEAKVENGTGKVELEVTLDRAGARVLEVAIAAPAGDELPANDSRLLTFTVARDRVRLLHLAGRPTYDVRALRRWLKSDEAVDVVAFFILREGTKGEDDPMAEERELALIEFPVNELFTTHLPSFDAVILQDIDAVRYKLDQHLPRLARYVESGGGLIMVGGPSSFAGGNYAQTPIDAVLPVEQIRGTEAYDPAPFVPAYTDAGRAAPMTRGLRDLVGDELPTMHGANLLGPARPGSIVLWEHPTIRARGQPMPLLAMGEIGDGRSIALAVDDTHLLAFSEYASKVAGRAYGALWDGLLGWLMRDPRYEAARVSLASDCIAGESFTLHVTRLPGMTGDVEASIEKLGAGKDPKVDLRVPAGSLSTVDLAVPALEAGGYTARVRIGAAPPTRHDFACERAGPAWSDSRPDPERLEAIAKATGGRAVDYTNVDDLPIPGSTEVDAERQVSPVLPPWMWTLSASVILGAHWVSRRRAGLL
ncbi:MAG TPA: glutamine amidotransferase [Polyangiaceae bacterium]|jgi:uncharacterized membrane protein|nr:glutamine amidotransferase [Polyangiaceae bacterium]